MGYLRSADVGALCSSRSGAAFAMGAARQCRGGRLHVVLNSLSADLLAASLASIGEGGAFIEIGKRSIWTPDRHAASAPFISYRAIAIDAGGKHERRKRGRRGEGRAQGEGDAP